MYRTPKLPLAVRPDRRDPVVMTVSVVLPSVGAAFEDQRDGGRWMRLNGHGAEGLLNFSIWRGRECAASFHLRRDEIPDFIASLVRIASVPDQPWSSPVVVTSRRYRLRLTAPWRRAHMTALGKRP
jgi:hypothetical protein